jgi:hypothetical protein
LLGPPLLPRRSGFGSRQGSVPLSPHRLRRSLRLLQLLLPLRQLFLLLLLVVVLLSSRSEFSLVLHSVLLVLSSLSSVHRQLCQGSGACGGFRRLTLGCFRRSEDGWQLDWGTRTAPPLRAGASTISASLSPVLLLDAPSPGRTRRLRQEVRGSAAGHATRCAVGTAAAAAATAAETAETVSALQLPRVRVVRLLCGS